MTKFTYPTPVSGLRGLLRLDDQVLEQVRILQLQISPRRRVGKTVSEYRDILSDRMGQLGTHQALFPDSLLTVLYTSQTKDEKVLDAPIIIGMISMTVDIGQSFTEAKLFDLIVREEYRGQNISRGLIEYCHKLCRSIGVTRCIARSSIKHSAAFRQAFEQARYVPSTQQLLEFRFRVEG